MPMAHGRVTIEDDGAEVLQAGMAPALYGALKLIYADTGHSFPAGDRGRDAKRDMAVVANRLADALVDYLKGNAEVQIDVGGLQRVPAVPNHLPQPAKNALAPSTPKVLKVR